MIYNTRKKCIWGILLVMVLCIFLPACGKSSTQLLSKQLDLGQKYLTEGSYEKAVVAFTKAIEIESKSVEAYVGRGDAYTAIAQAGEAAEKASKNYISAIADYEMAVSMDDNIKNTVETNLIDSYTYMADYYENSQEEDLVLDILERWYAFTEEERVDLSGASVGDTVVFGNYKGEPIEWIVLDSKDGGLFLLSKYVLDAQLYNEEHVEVTWESCTLRSWLNNDFYTEAFHEGEQSQIRTTEVINADNTEYNTPGGANTSDKIFLLSLDEASTYFGSDEARLCYPTSYAEDAGIYVYSETGSSWWWLRSPGLYSDDAAIVNRNGTLDGFFDVDIGDIGVRPALWVNP